MLKAIAIDDEPIALDVVKALAGKVGFLDLVGVYTDAYEAMKRLQQEKIDLLFLDIKMPDISGIEFLRSIPHPPMVIFTTAYSEHAVQSFELDAIDYLLKPFSQSRFLKACNKAFELFELKRKNGGPAAPGQLFIKSGYGQVRVRLEDILYLQSTGNYMQFVLREEKILSRLTMTEAEALLPPPAFVRIHRSYIVASGKVERVERDSVWVAGRELPVGAGFAREIGKITGS
ncbi:LytTR family DNA-binding domain-containing protein [Puia sp.]|jgi:DNA-binding LytR/AlgR family response regulator|uniref:LytR/AlgR family response regulator transcription factor n=1 Tax=Puia sp. TaxID=2045100 RepID=UPI002F3FE114